MGLVISSLLLFFYSAKHNNRYTPLCPSVSPSFTLQYNFNKRRPTIIWFSPNGRPNTLVFSAMYRCCRNSKRITPSETIFYMYPTLTLEFGKLGKTNMLQLQENCRKLAHAAHCFDSSLANRMARSQLPNKFSGIMPNAT